MKISSKITSGILATVMALSPFVSSVSVIAAEMEETDSTTAIVETIEVNEDDVIVNVGQVISKMFICLKLCK